MVCVQYEVMILGLSDNSIYIWEFFFFLNRDVIVHTKKKFHITWPCEGNVPVMHFSPNAGCTIEEKTLEFQSSQMRI